MLIEQPLLNFLSNRAPGQVYRVALAVIIVLSVLSHVKVIRLFRDFTPLRAPGRSADLPAEVVRQRLEQLEARVSERDVLSLYAAH